MAGAQCAGGRVAGDERGGWESGEEEQRHCASGGVRSFWLLGVCVCVAGMDNYRKSDKYLQDFVNFSFY